MTLAPHGSPRDRGGSDAYYGRPPRPHKWLDGIGREEIILRDPAEVAEYQAGYDAEPDRKDWEF